VKAWILTYLPSKQYLSRMQRRLWRRRQRIIACSWAPRWFIFLKENMYMLGKHIWDTHTVHSQLRGTMVHTTIKWNGLTLSDAGPFSSKSLMSRSHPGSNCLHGCESLLTIPWGNQGGARSGAGHLPLPHIIASLSLWQTIYWLSVWHCITAIIFSQ
jgi:hypothetical protein